MALRDTPALRILIDESLDNPPLPDRFGTLKTLLEQGHSVTLASGRHPVSPADDQPTLVLGLWDTPPDFENRPASWSVHSVAGRSPAEIADLADSHRTEKAPRAAWKPWFPVIDYDRCTNCMQCLSFCLFGVYGVDGDRRIQVQNQDNCKTNCPACSRVCPEAAIMFPKYKAGPINGDMVSAADLQKEKMKVDISALLGGDVYDMLRLRSEKARSRFSKERDSDKALTERQKCLVKLAEAGDIPAEVLLSLPSPEEIARRAEEAAAKAQAALQR
jgi:Pyruvate/2-oxoacid:ferredoxin oxidoreductase delta subunit